MTDAKARRWLKGGIGWTRAAIVDNAPLKIVAFILALTVFFLVHSDKDAVYNFSVGVNYSMPSESVLASQPPDKVWLKVRGSRRLIKRLDKRDLERIYIDLSSTPSGEFVFQHDMVRLPSGLELVSINPASFQLQFETRKERVVPIEVRTVGRPSRGFTVASVTARPAEVTVRGAESAVNLIKRIETRNVGLDRSESFVERVSLLMPQQYVEVEPSQAIEVEVKVVPELISRKLPPLAVSLEAGGGLGEDTAKRFVPFPNEVTVVLHGPMLDVEEVHSDKVQATVQLTAADLVPGAIREVPVIIRGVPDGVAGEITPSKITIKAR